MNIFMYEKLALLFFSKTLKDIYIHIFIYTVSSHSVSLIGSMTLSETSYEETNFTVG